MDDRLKIADRVTILPDGPDCVYAHSWTQPLSLVGGADRILSDLIPLLDGSRTANEIATELNGYNVDAVAAVIGDLMRAGIVEPIDPADADRPAGERDQIAFFSQFALPPDLAETPASRGPARTGAEYQRRLAAARIAVLGAGRIGARLVQGLAASGVRHLTILDPSVVGPDDINGEAPYTARDLGAARAEVLRDLCAAVAPALAVHPVTDQLEEAALEQALAASSFAVVCPDAHDPVLLERVNRLALAYRLPWTSARVLGLEFRIGPTILPGETACYTCLTLRIASNAPSEREHRLLEDWQRTGRLKPVGLALTPGVDLLVLEVVKGITWFSAPSCYGKLYTLDLITMDSRRHPVLRIPRCPECGRPAMGRPTINAWQQSPPAVS